MIRLARGLTGDGFEVDFVCRAGAGPLDDAARDAGATIRMVGERPSPGAGRRSLYRQRLAKQIGRRRPPDGETTTS